MSKEPVFQNKKENNSTSIANAVKNNAAGSHTDNRLQSVTQKKQVEALANKATESPIQKKANTTGLPNNLKSGIENLSGQSMDDVKVHYNSSQPAQLNAHAFAQGNQIHVASGQEKHLPHEAWHVVQQKQGRVKPTNQLKSKININDDVSLEKEADVMGAKALHTSDGGTQKAQIDFSNSKTILNASSSLQRIRIKLDHANDLIMNNVRAAKVPKPGTKMVDGFKDYDPNHPPIKDSENIVLEGHGTYLNDHHEPNAPYDSQAELNPQQLANIAFMIPKGAEWHGQIILFGCATGPLTLEVSKHYLALSGKSVNVVGTLADIRMEVPDGHDHLEHRAEYDAIPGGFPKSPHDSISARSKFLQWIDMAQTGVIDAVQAITLFKEDLASGINKEVRAELVNKLSEPIQYFKRAITTKLNYEGLTYNKDTNINSEVQMVRHLLQVADDELMVFKLRLADPHSEERVLDDEAVKYNMFFDHLMSELHILERLAMISEESIPNGVVDWEGENVVNSKANDAEHYPVAPLSKAGLISDKWGNRGGGQMLMHVLQHHDHNDEE